MRAQAERLLGLRGKGHGVRGGGARPELVDQHGYDTKYAMHCARLAFQCHELLTTGRLSLPVQDEAAAWLLDVRHGRVPFDEWWQRSLELDHQLAGQADDPGIRPAADRATIEAWAVATHLRHWTISPGPSPAA